MTFNLPLQLKPTEQLNEDMDKMFEGQASEDFSLDQLSSATDVTASWTPGYSDESQVRDMSELRLREMDIDCEFKECLPIKCFLRSFFLSFCFKE